TPSAVPVLGHPGHGGGDHRTLHGQADGWLSRRAVRTSAPAAATLTRRQAPERVHGKPNQEPPWWISPASGTGEDARSRRKYQSNASLVTTPTGSAYKIP